MLRIIDGFVFIDDNSKVLTYDDIRFKYPNLLVGQLTAEDEYLKGNTGLDGLFVLTDYPSLIPVVLQKNSVAVCPVVTPVFDDGRFQAESAQVVYGAIEEGHPGWAGDDFDMPLVKVKGSFLTHFACADIFRGDIVKATAKPSVTLYTDSAVEGFSGRTLKRMISAPVQAPAYPPLDWEAPVSAPVAPAPWAAPAPTPAPPPAPPKVPKSRGVATPPRPSFVLATGTFINEADGKRYSLSEGRMYLIPVQPEAPGTAWLDEPAAPKAQHEPILPAGHTPAPTGNATEDAFDTIKSMFRMF